MQILTPRAKLFLGSRALTKLWLTFLWVTVPMFFSFGQLTSQGYIEIETTKSQYEFTIISAATNGIVLIQKQNKPTQEKERDWKVIILDTNLNENNIGNLKLRENYDLIGYEITYNYLFLLFHKSDDPTYDFQLVKVKFSDHSLEWFTIKHESNLSLTHFSVAGHSALFGGYINHKPIVLLYNTLSKKLIAVPGFFMEKSKLFDLNVNRDNTFNALLMEEDIFRKKYLTTKIFSPQGQLLLKDSVRIKDNIDLLSGMTSRLHRNDLMVLGTYTKRSSKKALGFYALPIDPLSNQSIQYHAFSSLNHFFDYMGPERSSKMKLKTEKRIKLGKSSTHSAYTQIIKIKEGKMGFFLLAETLNASPTPNTTYNTGSRYNSQYNSYAPFYNFRPYSSPYTDQGYIYRNKASNEIQYVQSLLVLFNEQGKPIWDMSISMESLKYANMPQMSDFVVKKKSIWLAYKKEGKLLTNVSYDSSTFKLDTLQIPMRNKLDKMNYEYSKDTGVQSWYGNYLYVWGYRDVEHIDNNGKEKHVLYICKFKAQ